MASKKLVDCAELTAIASDDWIPVGDSSASDNLKKASPATLAASIFAQSMLPGSLENNSFTGESIVGTAGEALTIGQVCYLKSDGKFWKAKADASSTMPGLAMATASIDADATGAFLTKGFIKISTGFGGDMTIGGMVYVSDGTAGAIAQTAPADSGEFVQLLGVAYAARTLWFSPNLVIVEIA